MGARGAFEFKLLKASYYELISYSYARSAPSDPLTVTWKRGQRSPQDVIWIGVVELVVSPAFHQVLRPYSGWSTYPVEIIDGWGTACPGFHGLAIHGRCGPVFQNLSQIEGEGLHAKYVGMSFDPETWDRSDIFYPEKGPGPIVSPRLGKAMIDAALTNCVLTPLTEVRSGKLLIDQLIEQRKGPYFDGDPWEP